MAWSVLYSGSNTIGTTEFSLTNNSTTIAAKTDKGAITLVLDVSAVAFGDEFEVKCYDKCRSGDTQRVVDVWSIIGQQVSPIWMSPSLPLGEGWDFTIKKLNGTDRAIQSSIRSF